MSDPIKTDNDPMRVPLQSWYDVWLAEHKLTDLLYVTRNARGEVSLPQVHFVRDRIAGLVWSDVGYYDRPREPEPRTDCTESAWVIGEHYSKSVRLPVYSLERPDRGLRFTLRDNYYDWKLSVESEVAIDDPLFPYLFHTTPPIERAYTGDSLSSVYFEGFPEDRVFGYHATNPRRWSAELASDQRLWTVMFLCLKALGIMRPMVHLTRESHRAMLDADNEAHKRFMAREKEMGK